MVVLIITSTWWRCEDSVSMAARKVAQILAARGVRVFCTCAQPITEISEDVIRDAEYHHIAAFVCGVPGIDSEPSSIEWICKYHDKYYKYLFYEQQHFGEISQIVAFAPLTAKTAFEVQLGLYRQYGRKPSVHLINHRCIQEESDDDLKILDLIKDWVGPNGADTVWSLGPKLYDSYENWYGGLEYPMQAKHKLLLLSPVDSELTYIPPASLAQCRLLSVIQDICTYPSNSSVLSFDETTQQYQVMAEALHEMKPLLKHGQTSKITWAISDSTRDLVTSIKEQFRGVNVIYQNRSLYTSPIKLKQQFKQSHFFVAPDTDCSFNMTAWLALGCGLPTLVTADSAVGQTLLKLFGEHNDISFKYFLVEDEQDETWKRKLMDLIKNMSSTVQTAQKLQTMIADSHYIHEQEDDFVKAICEGLRPAVRDGAHPLMAQSIQPCGTMSSAAPQPHRIMLYPAAIQAPVQPIHELGSLPSFDRSKTCESDMDFYPIKPPECMPPNDQIPIRVVPTKTPEEHKGSHRNVPSMFTADNVSSASAMAVSEGRGSTVTTSQGQVQAAPQVPPPGPPTLQGAPQGPPTLQGAPQGPPTLQGAPQGPPTLQGAPQGPPTLQGAPQGPPTLQGAPQGPPTPQGAPQGPPTLQGAPPPKHSPDSKNELVANDMVWEVIKGDPEKQTKEESSRSEGAGDGNKDAGDADSVMHNEFTDMRQLVFLPQNDDNIKWASEHLNPDFKWLKDSLGSLLERIADRKKHYLFTPVYVAVLDSGICGQHPDLKGMVIENKCFVPDLSGDPSHLADLRVDRFNHGTMVAGILWQYAPFVKILNLKVLSHTGQGSLQNVVDALEYIKGWEKSKKLKVDIINMSLGDRRENEKLERLLAELALEKVIVCAATNDGRLTENTILNPANSGNCICVGSHTSKGERCAHSAVGQQLDFLCPGDQIQSTVSCFESEEIARTSREKIQPPNIFVCCFVSEEIARTSREKIQPSRYFVRSGTSFAAPHASAISAIVLALAQLELRVYDAPIPQVLKPLTENQIGCYWRKQLTCTKTMKKLLCRMGTGQHDRHRGHGILHPKTVLRNHHIFATNLWEVLGLEDH